ncbi:unnamed protein product, partial [marine sediment metagenome]
AIIVHSLEENELGKESFKHVKNWADKIKQFSGDIPVVVFSNKIDLVSEDNLDSGEIQKLVDDRNFLGYYMTSAKTGKGVITAFDVIIDALYIKFRELSPIS